jgi:hypothetical protein
VPPLPSQQHLALSSTPCLPNMVQNIQGIAAIPAWMAFIEENYSDDQLRHITFQNPRVIIQLSYKKWF